MPRIYRSLTADGYALPPSQAGAQPSCHIREFHEQLPDYAPTPLVSLPSVAHELGVAHVFLKNESARFGLPSFKILGASWASARAITRYLGLRWGEEAVPSLQQLSSTIESRGASLTLFAATEGNHGRAVARVAKLLRVGCIIYVPCHMPPSTSDLIASEDARIVEVNGDYDLAVRQARAAADVCEGGLLIQDTAFEHYEEVCQVCDRL